MKIINNRYEILSVYYHGEYGYVYKVRDLIDKSSHYSEQKDLNDYLKSKNILNNNLANDVDESRNTEQTNSYRRKR